MTHTNRQSYLQFHIPLNLKSQWYRNLTAAIGGIRGIKWQQGFFHITAAFINNKIDVVEAEKVADLLGEELGDITTPVITFDTLDAFITQGCGMYVIYLTASLVPDEWSTLIEKLRSKLIVNGYQLGPYQMHITLARIPAQSTTLESLRNLMK